MFSNVKTEERELVRRLRREEGASIKEIARRVGVSTSSVSCWVRDIELTQQQHDELRRRNPAYNRQISGVAIQAARRREERLASQEEGRLLARVGEPLHVAGCMLYWAEGSKRRNQLRFANSDPEMARFFVNFLRTYFDLPNEKIRITCHLYADHVERQRAVERFWLDTLGLSESSLRKSVVNAYSRHSKMKRLNVLPYGTVHIAVGKTSVTQSIFGSIQEYVGFRRDEWLDG
jgi:transposase-like protein